MSDNKVVKPDRARLAEPAPAASAQTASAQTVSAPAVSAPAAQPTGVQPADPTALLPPAAATEVQRQPDKLLELCQATLASIGASQTAIASDLTAMALELGEIARSNLTATGDSVTALTGARTMVDAVEIQLGLARRSLAAIATGSGRLSEIGLHLVSGAAKPFLAPLAER
ncbi:MAG TPA: phasin family protein [Stellaceae bacterium]|nr:phasin family protein [Stellaceae bacterium]